jgi:small subunit ribosomal protein S3
MGQKVHPNGIRLGITKPWNSTWFANTKDFADNLYSDFQVRQFLTKELKTLPCPRSLSSVRPRASV